MYYPLILLLISIYYVLAADSRTHYSLKDTSESSDESWDDLEFEDYLENSEHEAVNSDISDAFSNKRSFACSLIKSEIHTGDSLKNLSPEDIDIIAAMGDSLASGRGLWPPTEVEFRGAAFPIGGDATIDGLVTIPNILLEFNENLAGVSHGMGSRDRLPDYQYNVAESGSETEDLPAQAAELVRRLSSNEGRQLANKWSLIIIATGTEEFCVHCDTPDHSSIRIALGLLRKAVNKNEFNNLNYMTFGVLAIPKLTVHSRQPETLFVEDKPLLNRKGHTYAAKWLWNRLMSGPQYNVSNAVFSEDSYYCPSIACPYFRTVQNFDVCKIQTEANYQLEHRTTILPPNTTTQVPRREQIRQNLAMVIGVIFGMALISVSIIGTYFYHRSKKAIRCIPPAPLIEESAPLPDAKMGG